MSGNLHHLFVELAGCITHAISTLFDVILS